MKKRYWFLLFVIAVAIVSMFLMGSEDKESSFFQTLLSQEKQDLELSPATFPTSNYNYRIPINISILNVDSNLTDVVVLIKFTDNTDIAKGLKSGHDIRFTNSTGSYLEFERENHLVFDAIPPAKASGFYWVRVPKISEHFLTTIYLEYGNRTISAGLDASNGSAVWDTSRYISVHHLAKVGDANDSTINNHIAYNLSSDFNLNGKIFAGREFDGIDDKLWIDDHSDYQFHTDPFAVSIWVKSHRKVDTRMIGNRDAGQSNDYWNLLLSGSIYQYRFEIRSADTSYQVPSGTENNDSKWHNLVGDRNTTSLTLYYDGELIDSISVTGDFSVDGNNITIGEAYGNFMNGSMDEVRIMNNAPSEDQIKFEFHNQNSTTNELIFGIVETFDGDYPHFTDFTFKPANNSVYTYNIFYEFNTTISQRNLSGGIEWEGVNYSLSKNQTLPNNAIANKTFQSLSAGTYSYYWWAYGNGTSANFNRTKLYYYTIPMGLNFTSPTPENATISNQAIINVTASFKIKNLTYILNGTRVNNYDKGLIVMLNFDNRSLLGENDTFVRDVGMLGDDAVCGASECPNWNISGKYGGGFSFSSKGEHLNLSANTQYNAPAFVNKTYAMWFKDNGKIPTSAYLFLKWDSANTWTELYFTNDNKLAFQISSVGDIIKSSTTFEDETWHQVFIVLNNTNQSIYIDGVIEDSSIITSTDTGNTQIHIGGHPVSVPERSFNGTIDEFRIWNRSLDGEEIASLYKTNLMKFDSTEWYFISNESEEGDYIYGVEICDINHNCISKFRNVTIDTTGPNCSLIKITPADIEADSTGTFEMIVNCTDPNGINTTKIGDHYRSFFTMTVDSDGGLPNRWQIFYPNNSLAEKDGLKQQVLRAVGRNESYWYEDIGQAELDANIYDYAVYDGNYGHFKIQDNGSDWALFNISGSVEHMVFKQSFPLNIENMHNEEKKDYLINKRDGLMVTFYDLERIKGSENYTLSAFGNFNQTEYAPNKNLNIHYCNSSYLDSECGGDFLTGSCSDKPPASDNCVYLNSMPSVALSNRAYTEENSSYIGPDVYGIIDGKIGGIVTTNLSYIYYHSETQPNSYTIRYANGSSGTDVNFNDSKLAFISTNDGLAYSQLEGTPDIYLNVIKSGDQLQMGGCSWDLLGNEFCSYNFYSDDIGDVDFPISSPNIEFYAQGILAEGDHTGENKDLNKTYRDNMTIHINMAIDPDAVGNVTHNLTLRNTDGTLNYTINASFNSSTDADVHIYFDTNNVPDGEYRMNVSAWSFTDMSDMKSHLTLPNFTIDNTPPIVEIVYPPNNTNSTNSNLDVNYTFSDNFEIDSCWWIDVTGGINQTITCGENLSGAWVEGMNYVTIWVNDTAGNENWTSIAFNIDITSPQVQIVYPPNNTNSTDYNLNVNYTFSDSSGIDSCWWIDVAGGTNQTFVCGQNLSGVWVVGMNYVTIWVNDTAGNENWSSIAFNIDTFNPQIEYISPTPLNNSNQSANNFYHNISLKDTHTGIANVTFCTLNLTEYCSPAVCLCLTYFYNQTEHYMAGLSDGDYMINATTFDFTGNSNSTDQRFFTIDTTPPNITNLVNITIYINESVYYDFDANETGVGIDTWFIDWGSTFAINSTGTLTNISTLIIGIYNINLSVNDSVGNLASSFIWVNVIPEIPPTTPNWTVGFPVRNFTQEGNISFDESITAEDIAGIDYYVLNDTSDFNISQAGQLTNETELNLVGIYWFVLTVNNTLGNFISGEFFINITITEIVTRGYQNTLYPNNPRLNPFKTTQRLFPNFPDTVPHIRTTRRLDFR